MDRFKNEVVAITGGTRGVGLAAAEAFAAQGAAVAIAGGSDQGALDVALDRLASHGGRVQGALVDVQAPRAIERWVDGVGEGLGLVTVAVAAAGNLALAPVLDLTEAAWDTTIDTHLKGTFFFLQAVARKLRDAKQHGSLITVTSFGGVKAAGEGLIDYSAAKGGIVALTRSMARELLPLGIRVNSVLPAAETRMTDTLRAYWGIDREIWNRSFPQGAMPTTEEIADVFLFLGGPWSRHVTGQILAVDAGFGLR